MVYHSYILPLRKARICRIAGLAFLLVALANLATIVVAGIAPGGVAADCRAEGCRWRVRPTHELLFEDHREVAASPAAARTFDAYAARPRVRLGLAGVSFVETAPFVLLLASVGLALRRMGGRSGDPLSRALPWLRRASIAAIGWALARPVADSLRETLLSPGLPSGPQWQIVADFAAVAVALLLAAAACATIWAVEAAVRARRDLDAFV